jgi:hypothetical protein
MATGSLTLLTARRTPTAVDVTVNAEKMMIGSLLLKDVKEALAKVV